MCQPFLPNNCQISTNVLIEGGADITEYFIISVHQTNNKYNCMRGNYQNLYTNVLMSIDRMKSLRITMHKSFLDSFF